ncbi:MAG: endonuclease/exonuclease/phosphatase family protein [Candidatus Pacebacteria bacterium]|nr:endonuclease/exonuclease/phosphatase family protein [Candidatus Paceibacterota bacterium]
MKLISLNIEGNKHLDDKILSFFAKEKADVLCLQEVFAKDIQTICQSTGLDKYSFVSQAKVTKDNPHLPTNGLWGLCVFAKNLSKTRKHYYNGNANQIPEFFAYQDPNSMNRCLLTVEIELDGEVYQLGTTHFTWSGEGKVSNLQKEHFTQLKSFLADYPEIIFCGDLNTPRGGQIYDQLAKMYKDNIPSKIDTTIDKDIHKSGKDIRLVTDALFTSPNYQVKKVRVVGGVSDHKAVVAEIKKK